MLASHPGEHANLRNDINVMGVHHCNTLSVLTVFNVSIPWHAWMYDSLQTMNVTVPVGAQVNNIVALQYIFKLMLLAIFSAFYHLDSLKSNH